MPPDLHSANGPLFLGYGLLLAFVSINIFYYRHDRTKYRAVVSNLRPVRAIIFMVTVLAGAIAATPHGGFANFTKVFLTALSVFLVWEFSVIINDVYDLAIDRITNRRRPLPQAKLDIEEYRAVAFICALFAIFMALFVNFSVFLLSVLWIVLGIIYSAPPLRLRKNFGGNILIGFSLATSFMGGFLSLGNAYDLLRGENVAFSAALLILGTVMTLAKDLKDIHGDSQQGIKNVYSVYGKENGKKIVILLLFVGLISPFAFIGSISMLWALVPFALLTSYIYHKREDERIVYLLAAVEGVYLFAWLYLG